MKLPDNCFYCRKFIRPQHLTRDHFIPRSRRGSNHRSNVVRACRSCNVAKGCLDPRVAFNLGQPQPIYPEDTDNLERLRATVLQRAAENRYKVPFASFEYHPAVRHGDVSVRITDLLPEIARLAARAD
ncbi:HNH endonuclease [Hyphomicrobium sp.]|uniref:HNH endonuclease n=1 Tax=Hyphomicrobium sp. TaxID=82 RepID=UPI002FE0361B